MRFSIGPMDGCPGRSTIAVRAPGFDGIGVNIHIGIHVIVITYIVIRSSFSKIYYTDSIRRKYRHSYSQGHRHGYAGS